MANELKYSDSPYLLQHKDNPVEWMMWSDKAFDKAKKENKLIFLSIGYSTCHWCHVMERESFENEKIAKILNKDFISIKLDREEYPDIDKYYQNIYQVMHQRGGGWPLTIIMTPDKKVFYSATYIPPHTSHFGAGLEELLIAIGNDWHTNPNKIKNIANNLEEFLKQKNPKPIVTIDDKIIDKIINEAINSFDMKYGGMKGAPKFPMESSLNLLIDIYYFTKNEEILNILNTTLTKMAKGGIFDQIEGGFYRYSTDEKWLIPHFEKMLYNNANLPIIYLRMYKLTHNDLYKNVALRSIDEMLKRYRDKNGLFFSASNAESDGVEGKYFTYYYDEVESKFNIFKNKDELLSYFGIQKYGEFNGRNNPTIHGDKPQNYKETLKILQDIRKEKKFPFIDTKKITSWNSMMVIALFDASCFDKKYKKIAIATLNTLLSEMYQKNILYHSYNKNHNAKTPALLEDYAYLIKALITAYNYTLDKKYLDISNKLLKDVNNFFDNEWYMNNSKTIKADFSDNAYSSSLAILASDFLDLATISYDYNLWQKGENIIKQGSFYIDKYPLYYPSITRSYLKTIKNLYVITTNTPIMCNLEYPYLVFKKGVNYEVCTIQNCLKNSKNLDEIRKFLKSN